MKLNIQTVDDLAAEALAQAKQSARQTMLATLSRAADAITGPVPQAERDSWSTKEAAARAYAAETATTEQAAMLSAESAVTGEAVADLAASIVAKANAYAGFAATMAGLRRITTNAIDGATTPDEAQAALGPLQAALTNS